MINQVPTSCKPFSSKHALLAVIPLHVLLIQHNCAQKDDVFKAMLLSSSCFVSDVYSTDIAACPDHGWISLPVLF